jgi:hypothetical protein
MLDWDTPGYRVQNIDVIDRVTNAVLDSRSVANFRNGVYVVWQVSGSVRFRVTLSAGANAVVSGVFFGAP